MGFFALTFLYFFSKDIIQWHPTPVLLPGKSHGRRSLVDCSPWGHEELYMTERLHFHFSLSCIGEGNGNLLQCSCLENPRDGGAWWAAIYGVAQSRTWLKRLSSSSKQNRNFPSDISTFFFINIKQLSVFLHFFFRELIFIEHHLSWPLYMFHVLFHLYESPVRETVLIIF